MSRKPIVMSIAVFTILLMSAGVAYAVMDQDQSEQKRVPVEFYAGHTHDADGHAHGAPEHSGGTDRWGCHNGSVPYHCH